MIGESKHWDAIVVGAGIVGAAIAFGLARRGLSVVMLDGADTDFRAARANFGLVSLQMKGVGMPEYRAWTREAALAWAAFARELADVAPLDICFEQRGGVSISIGDEQFEARRTTLMRLHNQSPASPTDTVMIDRDELGRLLPRAVLGRDVTGASYCPIDGHANPMLLLRALHEAVRRLGGLLVSGAPVAAIDRNASGFEVRTDEAAIYRGDRVIVAAGIASAPLARHVGLEIPVRGQRGQVLVTERLAPFLDLPASGVRQTADGTVMIGLTQEEVGLDSGVLATAAAKMSASAVARFPMLAQANIVRQWAGLRVMSPDGFPIYAASRSHPGAYAIACHSGVTLASAHAGAIADAICRAEWPDMYSPFSPDRFDVSKVA